MPVLLRTKLFAPRPRRAAIRRSRLLARLDEASESALTVISAPAGYGKTWVVGEWLRERRIPAGWFSMDAADDDPVRFWTYLSEALRSAVPTMGRSTLELLGAPVPPAGEMLASVIINETADLKERLVCVLDDYHYVESRAIHDGLIFLVENAPPSLRLVVTTRSDPPWPLARLRAERRLSELRAADLRFDPDEATEFLETAGLRLTANAVQRLETRTDGWIAGLQMAVLSMRGRDDLDSFIDDFAGSHRFILDYLTEEVLARQPEDVLRFLLHTSILDRLEGGLCDAVTSSSGGARMLERLERANLFTDPLDDERRWYRYHPLLADVLKSRLRSSEPAIVGELHRRAATWFEAHGLEEEAVRHALEAGDVDQAARLISGVVSATFMVGNQVQFLSWLEELPVEVVRREPTLALAHAWARFVIADLDGIEDTLRVAAAAIATSTSASERPGLEAQLDAMRAWIAYQTGDLDQCIEVAHAALERLPADGLVPARIVTAALGTALLLKGRVDEASEVLEQTRQASRRAGDRLTESLALAILGQAELVRARLERAGQMCRRAIQIGTVAGEALPSVGIAQVLMGEVYREQGALVEAEHTLVSGIAICERALGLPEWVFEGSVTLARVLLATGDRARAATLMSRADALYETDIRPAGMDPLVQRALEYRNRYAAAAGGHAGAAGGQGVLIEPLNARELALLQLIAAGRTNQEIADELYLSVNTVKWHARNLYGKLGVKRRTQAVDRARELGML